MNISYGDYMKYLFSIGLILGLFSIIMFSGCVSENKQQDSNDNNWMYYNASEDEKSEDIYNNAEELLNSENAELKDNEIKHCVCHLMEIQYEYWIAKDELTRETTFGSKVKNIINKTESCAITDNVPKQCVPVNEAGGFEELRTTFLQETETMNCNCDTIEYDSKYFN